MASVLARSRFSRLLLLLLVVGLTGLLLFFSRGGDSGSTNGDATQAPAGPFVKSETASSPFGVTASNLSKGLTATQLAGQRIVTGFNGRTVPPVIRRQIRAGLIGGVILFSANLGSDRQIVRLTRSLQRIARPAGACPAHTGSRP